jgi:hypothetical protein
LAWANITTYCGVAKLTIYDPATMMMMAAAMSTPAKVEKKTPEDLPCVFRGGFMSSLGCCGGVSVYQCKSKEVFAETGKRACTINDVGRAKDDLASCADCPHRRAE